MQQLGSIAASALNAFGVDMLARANNIANMNTNGFKSQDVTLTTGPQGYGVAVASIYHNTAPGPLVPSLTASAENGREILRPGYVEASNTDISREFVSMIVTQRAYEANAVSVRAHDELSGTLLDMMV